MTMNGIPQSQHEAEIAAQAMRDKVNGANSHCCLSPGSPSDIPETDSLWQVCSGVAAENIITWADKCRILERERNRARSAVESLWAILQERKSLDTQDAHEIGLMVKSALRSENNKISGCEPTD